REDNADLRLTQTGYELGVVDSMRWDAFQRKRDQIAAETQRLQAQWAGPSTVPTPEMIRVFGVPLARDYPLLELLRRPGGNYGLLMSLPGAGPEIVDQAVAEQIEIQAKYQGYIERQQDEIRRFALYEETRLPADLEYWSVRGLSIEVQEKLARVRPETLGRA